jgi:hypothetical protein
MDRAPLRILIVSPLPPYPTHCGWSTSIYDVLVGLRGLGHEIHLLACFDIADADIESMRAVCSTEYFYRPKPPRWWQVVKNLGRSAVLHPDPQHRSPGRISPALAERPGSVVVSISPPGSRRRGATKTIRRRLRRGRESDDSGGPVLVNQVDRTASTN